MGADPGEGTDFHEPRDRQTMFETLTDRLNSTFRSLSGRGRISEENVRDAMREVRSSLLEADVNLEVVTEFCEEVTREALGSEVLKSLRPDEQMIGIVHARLVDLMGPVDSQLMMVDPPPTVVMMCGLQGTGKTTTCGKLAAWLKKRGKRVLVVAADLQRPAAVEQLRQVVEESVAEAPGDGHVAFHGEPDKCDEYGKATGVAVMVCQRALKRARAERFDVLLLDTAGRLHVDEDLMKEIEAIDRAVQPHQRMLVVDAMTGQDAVNSAREFNDRLAIDGVILTKFDSDTRGGAALSVKKVTGAPIKFVGVGEKVTALEEFHAERMAGRILGMGDVVSLVEKAHEEVEEEEAEKLAEKMAKGQFTLNDFTKQLRTMRRMGPLKQLLGMLPGVGGALKDLDILKQGDGVIANKDFMLVFFITCFLPFVRPNLPQIKPDDIKKGKAKSKRIQNLFLDEGTCDPNEFIKFDYDFYIQCKETMRELHMNKNELGFNEKSMYLKMY